MTALRVIVADDEPLAREALAALLAAEMDVELVGSCADGPTTVQTVRDRKPDLIFLDVQMPGLSGFEVVESLPPEERPAIVFVTAYDQHAIRAFELSAVDYLLKPVSDVRFRLALERARTRVRHADLDDTQGRLRRLLEHALGTGGTSRPAAWPASARLRFKVGSEYHLMDAADVVWIEAQRDHVKIAAAGQTHLTRETLQDVETKLDPGRFARVHRSFIVNLARIRKVATGIHGDFTLVMSDGAKIPVSRSRRGNVSALLG
jgi:two-component system LytT family response regulator